MRIYSLKNVFLQRKSEGGYSLHIKDFFLNSGEHIAITGRSGSGKSTVLDILALTLEPNSVDQFLLMNNKETFDVKELWKLRDVDKFSRIRNETIGFVLQSGGLFPFLSAEENLRLPIELKRKLTSEDRDWLSFLVETLNIECILGNHPSSLSFGERQRVAIARAMSLRPEVVFADEPTAALDPKLANQVMQLFMKAAQEFGSAIVMVSHDLALVKKFGFTNIPIQIGTNGQSAVLERSSP